MQSTVRTRLVKNLIGLALLPVVIMGLFRWFEYHQVYHPSRRLDTTCESLGVPCENVTFKAADGTRLHGWFFPPPAEIEGEGRVTLFCHGNAGNISHRLETAQVLLDLGVGVFLFDYRGYGRSEGRPSEEGTYQDADAAYQWLRNKGYDSTNVIAFGESLGGAVATDLAVHQPVSALILMSTFTSIPAMGADLFPWLPAKILCTIRYDTLGKLPGVKAPILIMHSRADSIVGYHHAEKLFAAAPEPKLFRELVGDHNDTLLTSLDEFRSALKEFLGR